MDGRLGMIIDGTGHDLSKIKKEKKNLEARGYDCYMVFVNTTLEIALERNQMRERVLPDAIVEKMWKEVQANLGKFSRLFGKRNMIIVDNSSYDDSAKILSHIEKEIRRRVEMPVQNYLGKIWIKAELANNKKSN